MINFEFICSVNPWRRLSRRNGLFFHRCRNFISSVKNYSYMTLPPLRQDCQPTSTLVAMDLIYPKPDLSFLFPASSMGVQERLFSSWPMQIPVLWFTGILDGNYLGSTKGSHNLPLNPGSWKAPFDPGGRQRANR